MRTTEEIKQRLTKLKKDEEELINLVFCFPFEKPTLLFLRETANKLNYVRGQIQSLQWLVV